MKPAFQKAVPVLNKIEQAGFEAYFVGGSVRDSLLKKEIDDVDIATSATPEEIKGIFSKTIDVGIEHGTVVVLYGGQSYEVTTYRSESEYSDFRRPNQVSFIRSLKDDLKRRDFTMNAIAMDKNGEIFDPFQGVRAIHAQVIETVGEAKERFSEDALRMMRAVRFVSQLSFTIEDQTVHALKNYGHLLENIAVERISTEFDKLLLGRNSQEAIKILIETKLYEYLPGLKGYGGELNHYSKFDMSSNFSIEECWVFLLYHLHMPLNDAGQFLKSWKQPIKRIKRIKKGLLWLNHRLQKDWSIMELYEAQEELVISTEKLFNRLNGQEIYHSLYQLRQMLTVMPINSRSELSVTGRDLMDWYDLKGGPWIEEKLQAIEVAVLLRNTENEKEAIKEWLFKCNQP